MQYLPNRRVLIVDDTPSIHDDFTKILAAAPPCAASGVEAALFGLDGPVQWEFQLDSAFQGEEALRRVEAAVSAGQPYAVAFVDMRMPPGWDGLETVERLWCADPRLEVVICTAYSDHPWDTLLERLDVRDRLLILKKPFDVIEVSQLARTLSTKWSLARQVEARAQERECMLEQLRLSEHQLRHRSQDLQAFAYSVSHDLRSPMALIGTFCRLLAGELGDAQERAAEYLHHIQANAVLGQQLVTGLFALTEVDRAELQLGRVDVGALVHQCAEGLRQAEPARSARVEVEPGLEVWGDARLLRVALRNLLENAWKFSSRRAETAIQVGLSRANAREQVLFVRDNGCGFDMAQGERLFRTFQRLHHEHEYPGSGVGLVAVERVARRHGGRTWCQSEPGTGSTFYLALPTAPLAAPHRPEQQR